MSRKVTIRDVANEAKVSIATVSRVLNNKCAVRPKTRNTILQAVEKLGYKYENRVTEIPEPGMTVPEEGTAQLFYHKVMEESNIIIVNIPTMSNPFYSKIIDGIHASAEMHSLSVVFTSIDINEKNVDAFIRLTDHLKAIGLIVLNSFSYSTLSILTSHLPVVQCCEYYDNPSASYVGINDYTATETAINYLLSMGRKKISLVNGPLEFRYAQNRLAAYQSVMDSANIEVPASWIIQLPELNHDLSFTSIVQVLSSPNPPDCFFAVSDSLAAAAIKAAQYCNLRVPSDILVIGFDNTEISQLATPSITTIKQPRYQLGYLACELLVEKIADPHSEIKRVKLPTELIIRESTTSERISME